MDRPILIASDGTPGSEGALRVGIALTRATQKRLEILTVLEDLTLYSFGELPSIPQGYLLLQKLRAEDLRNSVVRQVAEIDPEETWRVVTEIGSPAVAVAQHARKVKAELIIVGAGPRFGPDRWMRSETSLKIVGLAQVPVLLVPQLTRELPQSALIAFLQDFASRMNAGAIAARSHDYGDLGSIFMGGVSARLVRGGPSAVLIAPPGAPPAELLSHAEDYAMREPVEQLTA